MNRFAQQGVRLSADSFGSNGYFVSHEVFFFFFFPHKTRAISLFLKKFDILGNQCLFLIFSYDWLDQSKVAHVIIGILDFPDVSQG